MALRNINDLYNFFQYIVRKQRGVFQTASDFTGNLDAGQMDAVEEWFAGYGENQILHDALRPLRKNQPFISDAAGFVTFPSDYIHLLGSPYTIYGSTVNTVKFLNEDELPFALTSQLRPTTNDYPIAIDSSNGFGIYPQNTQQGSYWYLRRPLVPVLSFTQVGRVITYNPSTSVQLELNEMYWNHIIAKALVYAGVNMDDKTVLEFGNLYNQETKQ